MKKAPDHFRGTELKISPLHVSTPTPRCSPSPINCTLSCAAPTMAPLGQKSKRHALSLRKQLYSTIYVPVWAAITKPHSEHESTDTNTVDQSTCSNVAPHLCLRKVGTSSCATLSQLLPHEETIHSAQTPYAAPRILIVTSHPLWGGGAAATPHHQ